MNKKYILGIIAVVIVIIILSLFILRQDKEVKTSPNDIDFQINTEEDAIIYAKTDPDVKNFIENWSQTGYEIYSEAYFNENEELWNVSFIVIGVTDKGIEIQFKSNGNIINKIINDGR